MLDALSEAVAYGARVSEDRRKGQSSLFGDGSVETGASAPSLPDVPRWTDKEIWAFEKEALGFYVSGHPLSDFKEELRLFATATTDQAVDLPDESEVQMGGIITTFKTQVDKKGQTMAFFTIEDFSGSIECICFSDPYRRFMSLLHTDSLVLLSGNLSTREGERPKLKIQTVTPLSEVRNGAVLDVHLRLVPDQLAEGILDELESLICRFDKGNGFLFIYYPVGNQTVKIKSNRVRLEARRELIESLRELLGPDAVFCSRG